MDCLTDYNPVLDLIWYSWTRSVFPESILEPILTDSIMFTDTFWNAPKLSEMHQDFLKYTETS